MLNKKYKLAYTNGECTSTCSGQKYRYSFKVRIIETINDICEIRYDTKNLVQGGYCASQINGLSHIININKLEGIHEVDVSFLQRINWFLTEKYLRMAIN